MHSIEPGGNPLQHVTVSDTTQFPFTSVFVVEMQSEHARAGVDHVSATRHSAIEISMISFRIVLRSFLEAWIFRK